MIRRVFLKILTSSTVVLVSGLTTPIRLLAEWNESAFSAKNIDSAINSYFPNKEIKRSDRIKVEIYAEVENGAVVPVKINTDLENVKTITIFADKNPNPLIANFNLGETTLGFVSTRIKVSEPSNIIIIVNSNNTLYMAKKFVGVHENGCG